MQDTEPGVTRLRLHAGPEQGCCDKQGAEDARDHDEELVHEIASFCAEVCHFLVRDCATFLHMLSIALAKVLQKL